MKGLHVLSWSIAGCLTGGQEMEPWQKTQLSDLFEDGRPELPLQVDVTETQATAALPALQRLKHDVIGDVGATLWVLMGAIAIVLLMVCANVANLLLVRANGRARALAIRAALGASGMRVARQLLVETLLLAFVGGAVGLFFAYVSLRALLISAPANLPRLSEIAIDPVTLSFAVMISLLSGLLFGSIAIVKHARPRLDALGGGCCAGQTLERQRSQQVLVTAQMALALVLLVSAGLMIRSFQALRHLDPGVANPSSPPTHSR